MLRSYRQTGLRAGLLVVLFAVVLTAVSCDLSTTRVLQGEDNESITASGVIQASQVSVSSEFGGLLVAVPVRESESVAQGQVVANLDTTMLDAQIEAAQAVVDLAEAGLAQAEAGARPGKIAVAQAQLEQALVARATAQQALSDTLALVAEPQDIDLEIAVMHWQLTSARHEYAQAVALKDAIELVKAPVDAAYAEFNGGGRYRFEAASGDLDDLVQALVPDLPPELINLLPDIPDDASGDYSYQDWELHVDQGQFTLYRWVNVSFPLDAALLPNTWWQSWVGVNAADANVRGLESQLAYLYMQRAEPQEYLAQVVEAQNALDQVNAQVALAQVQVDGLLSGATPEQLAVIEARVQQARSGVDSLLKQKAMLSLTAPLTGTVTRIYLAPGEVAAQGAAILQIAYLESLTLKIYIPENRIGEIGLDQAVSVTVDSFPGRVFAGYVMRIGDKAEFTPRSAATQEERVLLVFAIEIRVVNEDGLLKPGMPADVVVEPILR